MDKFKFYLIKVITACVFSIFVYRAVNQFILNQGDSSLNLLLLVISESITVALILAARPAKDYAMNFIAITSAAAVTFYFLAINIGPGQALLPIYITACLQIVGMLFQITAKLYLGRSFGLVAANRGVVTTGPYKLVRHPIYLGYFVSHIGFVMGLFHWRNLLVFAGLYFFQALRIWQEEKLLLQDSEYAQYAKKTRYRILPYIL